MRLSISNIAWDVEEDSAVAQLLKKLHIDAIDIAPGKYFPDPLNANKEDIIEVRNWWSDHDIEIIGMQALLFGAPDLNIFGDKENQVALLKRLDAVCRIGKELGATRLVFGSPKNRDRSTLGNEQALDRAVSFFRRLGGIAQSHGVIICLEPNPPRYGSNFMMSSLETALVVNSVEHSSIQMQFDTGALEINQEDPYVILSNSGHLIGHIHASEPDLAPLTSNRTNHSLMYKAFLKYLPHHLVTIEMLATKNDPHLVSIKGTLMRAIEYYRPEKGVM